MSQRSSFNENELRRALSALLSEDTQTASEAIAKILISGLGDPTKILTVQGQGYIEILRNLVGSRVEVSNTVLAFEEGAQTGDITVRDVAGGNIVTINFNVTTPSVVNELSLRKQVGVDIVFSCELSSLNGQLLNQTIQAISKITKTHPEQVNIVQASDGRLVFRLELDEPSTHQMLKTYNYNQGLKDEIAENPVLTSGSYNEAVQQAINNAIVRSIKHTSELTVREIMTRTVHVVNPTMTVPDAFRLMKELAVSSLLVIPN